MCHSKNGEKIKEVYFVDKSVKFTLSRKNRFRNGRYAS